MDGERGLQQRNRDRRGRTAATWPSILAGAGRSSPYERIEKVTSRRPERGADQCPPGVVPCMPGPHGLGPFPIFRPLGGESLISGSAGCLPYAPLPSEVLWNPGQGHGRIPPILHRGLGDGGR